MAPALHTPQVVDDLFDEWDKDGEGLLDFKELNKKLRRGSSVNLAADLRAGAKGKIETKVGAAPSPRDHPHPAPTSPTTAAPRCSRGTTRGVQNRGCDAHARAHPLSLPPALLTLAPTLRSGEEPQGAAAVAGMRLVRWSFGHPDVVAACAT